MFKNIDKQNNNKDSYKGSYVSSDSNNHYNNESDINNYIKHISKDSQNTNNNNNNNNYNNKNINTVKSVNENNNNFQIQSRDAHDPNSNSQEFYLTSNTFNPGNCKPVDKEIKEDADKSNQKVQNSEENYKPEVNNSTLSNEFLRGKLEYILKKSKLLIEKYSILLSDSNKI